MNGLRLKWRSCWQLSRSREQTWHLYLFTYREGLTTCEQNGELSHFWSSCAFIGHAASTQQKRNTHFWLYAMNHLKNLAIYKILTANSQNTKIKFH